MDVGGRIGHGVTDAGLRGQVHHMGEGHHVEQLVEERAVVDVALDDEDTRAVEEGLAGALEGGVVVVVEVVEPKDAVAAALERGRDVGTHEAGGASDEDGDAAGAADAGGGAHALLPGGAAPRGGVTEGATPRGGGGVGGGG